MSSWLVRPLSARTVGESCLFETTKQLSVLTPARLSKSGKFLCIALVIVKLGSTGRAT